MCMGDDEIFFFCCKVYLCFFFRILQIEIDEGCGGGGGRRGG